MSDPNASSAQNNGMPIVRSSRGEDRASTPCFHDRDPSGSPGSSPPTYFGLAGEYMTFESGSDSENDIDRARAYLEELDIEVDTNDSSGLTALMVAAWEGRCDILENLLIAGVPANCVNAATGDNALILAASFGRSRVIKLLPNVQGLELNQANRNGDTALMLAASGNWHEAVSILVSQGADVNLVNQKCRYTALMLASTYGYTETVKILLRADGIDLNLANARGDTALILASAGKHPEVVRSLLAANADTTPVGSQGHTALSIAKAAKHAAIVEMLFESRQEINDFDAPSDSPDAFSVTVSDLVAIRKPVSKINAPNGPLFFFKKLSELIPANGDTGRLLGWLREQGLVTACAREVMSLVAPAHAWSSRASGGTRGNKEQHRLIYCISALGQMESTGAGDRIRNVYQEAGISSSGLQTLDERARHQLSNMIDLASEAAAELGSDFVNLLISHCLEQTSPKYEVRATLLQDCLVQQGFMEPLAKVIALGWQDVLAGMRRKTIAIPEKLSFVQTIDYIHQSVIDDAQTMLANVLKDRLKQHALLPSFETMLSHKQEEVVHTLFQTQCNWLSQFCERTLETN